MAIDIILIILGLCFILGGLLGCVIPAIPGPPLSYIALLLLQITPYGHFSTRFLIISAAVTIGVTVIDFILPAWGTRKWKGTRAGAIGAVIGLIAGLFFPPAGIILGPFAGAFIGELIVGRTANEAFRSGFGSFMGFITGAALKLAVSIAFTYCFIKETVTSIIA
jgi:uncharacterized protein YqgC (DUF456 family)